MKILTFDIEDWFHILDHRTTRDVSDWERYEPRINENLDRILELLSAGRTRATFFCLGWMGEKHPAVIKKITAAGHEVGSHGYSHQLLYDQHRKELCLDLRHSLKILEDLTGQPVRYYRAPGFSIKEENKWAFEVLVEQGIEVDCSIFPTRRAHGGFPSYNHPQPAMIETAAGPIKECPISVRRVFGRDFVFSGGGYFRLFPYSLLRRWVRKSDYLMTYFHPRDFDPDQPVVPQLSPLRRFKSYYGLSSAAEKLSRMIEEFRFQPLSQAVAEIDWTKARVIRL